MPMSDEGDRSLEAAAKDDRSDTQAALQKDSEKGREDLVSRQREDSDKQKQSGDSGIATLPKTTIVQDQGTEDNRADAPARKERTDPSLQDKSGLPDAADGKDYRGENIKIEVTEGTHTCTPTDSLTKIASERLGTRATPDDVAAYVREIKTINHLPSDDLR